VVPTAPLTGVFTRANLQLLSGIGENPFGRFAVDDSGDPAVAGNAVDGESVLYERFALSVLMVPTYFDPATLGPPEYDGNRILLAAFEDQYGTPFNLGPLTDDAQASFFDNAGVLLTTAAVQIDGVLLTDLQSVAGATSLNGADGGERASREHRHGPGDLRRDGLLRTRRSQSQIRHVLETERKGTRRGRARCVTNVLRCAHRSPPVHRSVTSA